MAGTEYIVRATDAASAVFAKIALAADGLDTQLEDLSKRIATPEVDLEDSKFTLGMVRAAERLDKLSAKVADPKIDIPVEKAQREILLINAMIDRATRDRTVTVDVRPSFMGRVAGRAFGLKSAGGGGGDGFGGLLGRIFGGGAQAAGAGSQAGTGFAGSLGQYGTPALYGSLGILGALLAPALLPVGLGVLAGGGAGAGAFALGSAANKQMQALAKQLASAKPGQRGDIRAQMAALQKQSGPELSIFGAFQDLGGSLKDTFAGALKAPGAPALGPSGRPIAGSGGPSFLTGLTGILKQFGGFVKTIGPQLADMFRASLPFLQMFVKFLEQAAKTLLPVFTQMLQQMTPILPLIAAGLMHIVDGFAGFLKALGPQGMQASAKIFVALTIGMEYALKGLGIAVDWLAKNIPKWVHDIAIVFDWLRHRIADNAEHYRAIWDDFRHRTAVIFDGVRHDIAHIWDMIFQNSIGMVIRLVHNVETQYNSLRHGIAVTFDTIRHDVATAWDTIWNNTVDRVKRGIGDVVNWFKGLPGKAINAVEGLGTSLYNFAHMAMTKLWNGLKNVFSSVWDWFKSLPSKLLNAIGIHSPPDWAIQAGKHIMGGLLHGITSRKDELLAQMNAISQAMGGGIQGRFGGGGSVLSWITAAIRGAGAPMSWLPALARLVSLESGGNPNAVNPTAIAGGQHASGLWQMLPSTFAAYGGRGSLFNPVIEGIAALRYISNRYGSPFNIPGLFSGGYRGYAYGTGSAAPGWAVVGERGPELVRFRGGERVTPGGGGTTINLTVNVPPTANPRETARQIIGILNQGATAGMKLRTSILGPG